MDDDNTHRTIDDFLDELYTEYKIRHINHDQNDLLSDNPDQNLLECISNIFLKVTQQIFYRFCFTNRCKCKQSCSYHKYLPLPLLALCIANSSDATEILMLSYLLANPTFRHDMFGHQNEHDSNMEGAEYLASSIFLGMLLGGTVLGFLSDSMGRRPALLIGLLTNAIAGTLSAVPFLTPSFVELTVLRFIAGIGIGATVPPLFSLASEWSPKEIRGSVVTAVASFWMVGSLFVSTVAWCLFRDSDTNEFDPSKSAATWRMFAAFCALPSALGAVMVYRYVPESPRFLAARHDYSQAARSCNQMMYNLDIPGAAASEVNFETCSSEQQTAGSLVEMPPRRTISAQELKLSDEHTENNANHNEPITATRHPKFAIQSFFDTLSKLYSRQLLSQTTLPLQSLWFSLSFGTYGITTWINSLFVAVHLQNMYFNSFLFALANLPGNIISILYSDKWGRKRMLVGSLLGAAGSLAGFAILVYFGGDNEQVDTNWFRTNSIVLFACAFQMFSITSWNTIDIISGELFPTRVRSAGMGVCTASGRMGAMIAQVANAKLMMNSSSEKEDSTEAVASAWVLVVASIALLFGALMPVFLGRDASGGELKDDVAEVSRTDNNLSRKLVCGIWRNKDHLSDEEENEPSGNSDAKQNAVGTLHRYDSFRHEVEANQPFLL